MTNQNPFSTQWRQFIFTNIHELLLSSEPIEILKAVDGYSIEVEGDKYRYVKSNQNKSMKDLKEIATMFHNMIAERSTPFLQTDITLRELPLITLQETAPEIELVKVETSIGNYFVKTIALESVTIRLESKFY